MLGIIRRRGPADRLIPPRLPVDAAMRAPSDSLRMGEGAAAGHSIDTRHYDDGATPSAPASSVCKSAGSPPPLSRIEADSMRQLAFYVAVIACLTGLGPVLATNSAE